MTSPHRFLSNDRNAAFAAALAAGSVLPAEATAFPLARTRSGSARAALSGGYTGAADGALDLEILTAVGADLISEPVFVGAGNGALSELTAAAVPAQVFTLLLASTGTRTEPARVEFFGVVLQAKAAGTAGNGLTLTTDRSALVAASTVYSFLEPVAAGTSELRGAQWDFGAYALTAAGELDARTVRLRFGHDPQIYRQYKVWSDGDWLYLLDPPLVRDLPAETLVFTVTGTYTVTVTLGSTVETYAALTTLFDGLNALRTLSNLVEVVGVVVKDRTPGGMDAEDWPLRTDAYALPAAYQGNARFPGLGAVAVPSAAPTEIITLTCIDIATLGGERWAVRGTVTGGLPQSVSGVPYASGGYGWTVPRVFPEVGDPDPSGRIYVKDISFAGRPPGAEGLELCIKPLVAGAKARAKTIEVVYTEKPPVDCLCDNAPVVGRLDSRCLGVDVDEDAEMAIVAAYRTRLEALYGWRKAFIASNTALRANNGALLTVFQDVDLANRVTAIYAGCLADLFAISDEPEEDALDQWDTDLGAMDTALAQLEGIAAEPTTGVKRWNPSTEYDSGDDLLPPVGAENGHKYRIIPDLIEYNDPNSDVPAYLVPTAIRPNQDPPSWPTNGGSVKVTGHVTFTFTGTLVRPGTATIFDLGPYDDADSVSGDGSATIRRSVEQFVQRYVAEMDYVRALAGIVPKSDASLEGTECWRPCEGNFEWRVNGSEYLPACTNVPYHSVVREVDASGREVIVPTQEFGFVIRCACPERLLPGDRFTLVIDNDAQPARTYAEGDTIKIPVIAARALDLAGGVNGDNTLTWTVRGSLNASWPNYAAPIGAEPLYDQAGLQFRLRSGGVPFDLGDRFTFAVAGGTFRWRWDAGTWSASTPLAAAPTDLGRGLGLTWQPGPAPAFVAEDEYAWTVKQPHAPALALHPDRRAWRWSGAGSTWTATFAADTPIAAVALWHDCPAGAVFTLEGLSAADALLWTRTLVYRPKLALAVLENPDPLAADAAVADCRKLRLTVASATGGAVRWVWCGTPWTPVHCLSRIVLRESWEMRRGARSARSVGRGAAGEIEWSAQGNSWLESADWASLLALLDYLKAADDEALIFVPNAAVPGEARLTRIGADDVDFSDINDFLYEPRRLLDVRLPLATVLL